MPTNIHTKMIIIIIMMLIKAFHNAHHDQYPYQLSCKMVLASRMSQTNPLSYRIGLFVHRDQPIPVEPALLLGWSGR